MKNLLQNKTVPRVTGTLLLRGVMMYAELTQKRCTHCNLEKPLEAFSLKRGKPNSRCKMCIGAYMQKHYFANRGREVLKRKAWYKKNQVAAIASVKKNYAENKETIKFRRLFLKYGLTKETYLQMHESQKGMCAAGHAIESSEELVVDHCHSTNRVRGLLCHKCNTSFGLLKEDQKRILGLLGYAAKCQK